MTAQIVVLAHARRALHVSAPKKASPVRHQLGRRPDDRKAQYELWRKAILLAEFHMALRQLQIAATNGERHGHVEAGVMRQYVGDYFRILDDERKAVARCILTPAPTRREIEWKRLQLRRGGLSEYITEAKALAAIAADEKWHDENPYRRVPTRAGKGSSQ